MFRFKNLKYTFFGYSSHFGSDINTTQFINLAKNDIYPKYYDYVMRQTLTTLIVHSGKLFISLYDSKKQQKITLFSENNCLGQIIDNNSNIPDNKTPLDDIIFSNKKHALYIYPGIFYSTYSSENTHFQTMFNSDKCINYYTFNNNKNKYFISSIEYI